MAKNKLRNQTDMLNGSLMNKIILFAIPLAASSILQQLFNSADVAVVGHYAGSRAMAAVGGNSSVISLLINLFAGLSVGANVVIANYIGRQEPEKVHDAVHTVISLAFLSGILLLGLGIAVARPILELIDTPPDVLDQAVLYLRIYFLGMPFFMLYNFGAAILRSTGDTKRPLFCLTISGLINVGLNLLLVIVFKLDVAGVAIATAISNGVSAGFILFFLRQETGAIHFDFRALTLKKEPLLRVVRIGMPAGIQGMVFSLSNVCIQSAINGFGSNAVAGSAAAVNFEFFTYFVTNAFSQAAVTFISQNYGAGKLDRCKKVFRCSMFCGLVMTTIMSASFVLGKGVFLRFYSSDEAVISFAQIRMLHVELFACLPVIYEVAGGALRGMGYSMMPAILTLIGSCALRFVWVYTVFNQVPTFPMLMDVYPVSWILTGAMVLTAYWLVRCHVTKRLEKREVD